MALSANPLELQHTPGSVLTAWQFLCPDIKPELRVIGENVPHSEKKITWPS